MLSTAPMTTPVTTMSTDLNLSLAQEQEQGALSPRSCPQSSPAQETKQGSFGSSPSKQNPPASLVYNTNRDASFTAPSHHNDESRSGFGYVAEQVVESPPAAPSAPRTSLTNFLPASIRTRLSLSVQEKPLPLPPLQSDDEDEDEVMGLTGEGRKTRRELAESQLNLDTAQHTPQQAVSEGCPSPETTPKRLVRSSTAGPQDSIPKSAGPATAPTRMSLLAMFTRNAPPSITPEVHNELLSMNVDEALFPGGAPSGKDSFSPAAFKNLQTQATGILAKIQTAYRQKAQALAELEKEREADRDELEEAETRATHLKLQLEDMAAKASEQERRMKQLMDELTAERRNRADERSSLTKQRLSPGGLLSEAGSTISEDLGVDEEEMQKRKWRKSNGTDTSFETDDDSISFEGESVFSRPRSPSASTTTTTRGADSASVIDISVPTPSSMRSARGGTATNRSSVQSITSRPRSTQQMTTFQKLMKGISGDDGCRNCKGQDASIAWDTVGQLRDENKHLKHRVGELEDCLEGALDAVNGIGI